MKASDFERKYKISDSLPSETEMHTFSPRELSDALSSFFEDEFDGLVNVIAQSEKDGAVRIAEEYLAHFFKTLLRLLYGKRLLTLRLCVEVDSFCILATCEGGILVNRSELGTLFRDARNAGFEIERFPDGFRLSAPLLPRRDFALHAISEGITLLVAKLRKIFFD